MRFTCLPYAASAAVTLCLASGHLGYAEPSQISFSDFASDVGLGLQGPATVIANTLLPAPPGSTNSGAAWLGTRWFIAGGFETVFQFRAVTSGNDRGAGFALVVQNNAVPALGRSSEGLGYEGIPQSFAVEFDFCSDIFQHDPAEAHIALQAEPLLPNSADHLLPSLSRTATAPNLADGQIHTVKVQLSGLTLNVFLDAQENPVLTCTVTPEQGFKEMLGLEDGLAWLGFTAPGAGQGGYVEILSWQIANNPTPLDGQLAAPVNGASFLCPGPIPLATVLMNTAAVERVEFRQNGQKIGEATVAPWSYRWMNVLPGEYSLDLATSDAAGNRNVSLPTRVVVHPDAPPIGINFVDDAPAAAGALHELNLTGVVPQRFWNNVTSTNLSGRANNLCNGSGIQTSVDVMWSAPGKASDPAVNGARSASYQLMNSGLLANSESNSVSLSVQQVGYELYDVLVYTAGGSEDTGSEVIFWLNGQEQTLHHLPRTSFAGRFVEARATSDQDSAPAGNYVRFNGLTNSTFTLTATTRGIDANPHAIITGLQIVSSVNAAAAVQLTRGPYLQAPTTTNIVIRWRTNRRAGSRVLFGPSPNQLTQSFEDPLLTTEHMVRLENLQPGQTYYYSVGTPDEVLLEDDPKCYFVTTPANELGPTTICVTSDTQTGNASQRAVRTTLLSWISEYRADRWISLGDSGGNLGSDGDYQANFFEMYAPILRHLPVAPTLGNHDTYTLTAEAEPYMLRFFSRPTNGEAGGIASGSNRYFSFDHKNIHFVCLDSASSDRSLEGAQYRWLQADLAQNTKTWLIAFFHHTPYTKGSHDSDNSSEVEIFDMRANFLPLLEENGVDLVLCGHSHVYERSYFMDGHYGTSDSFNRATMIKDSGDGLTNGPFLKPLTGTKAHRGTVYITAGISGEARGGTLDHPSTRVPLNRTGFLIVDVDGATLRVRFFNETGLVADEFTMEKRDIPTGWRITSIQLDSGCANLAWQSDPGKTYSVLWTPSLAAPEWRVIASGLTATNGTTCWTVPLAPATPTGFYQVSCD